MDDEARGKRLLVIFKSYNAYVDESGTHDGSPVVALAGYLSPYQGWNDFEDQWNRIMRRFRVNDFHMTDFETHHAEFEDNNYWTPDIRTRLMERVTALCQQKTTLGIGCAVIREQYDRLLSPKIRHDLRHPYYFCLYACLNMLLHSNDLRVKSLKPIQFLFDQKPGRFRLGSVWVHWETHAGEFFRKLRGGLDAEGATIGEISFGKRREYPQLRAADLLVYEVARMRMKLWKKSERDMRKSLAALAKDMNLLVTFPDEQEIRNFGKIIETAAEAEAKGMNEQEIWTMLREKFPKKDRTQMARRIRDSR